MRLFLAINIPSAERDAMHLAATPLRAVAPDVSWIPAERLHLTLEFLGEKPESEARRLSATLARVVAPHRPFTVATGGAGAFPNFRQPRVVWMGVADDPKLELLHHDVAAACVALGHEVVARPFRAHVTVGRVRRPLGADAARALAAAARAVRYEGTFEVRSVDLMRSEQGKGGSRYTLLSTFPLEGGA